MRAVVVYESHWGNTAAVAEAIARGLGAGAVAVSTADASPEAVADADLIVAGAPVLGFRLPTDQMLAGLANERSPRPADLRGPSMRSWLAEVPAGHGRAATFETGIWWSPGGATGAIARELGRAGYEPVGKGRRFVVNGRYGPLRDGELERAERWGAELRSAVG